MEAANSFLLRSLWGVLAAAAVIFPGAAALLKVPLAVENSKISILYPVIGVIVSAFALLLATAYRDQFSELARARRWAVNAPAASCFKLGVSVLVAATSVRTVPEIERIPKSIPMNVAMEAPRLVRDRDMN